MKSKYILTFVFLTGVFFCQYANAQVNDIRKTKPVVDHQKKTLIKSETKKTKTTQDIQTKERDTNYKIVDGRKVMIDNQGVQSLAIPVSDPSEKNISNRERK